MRKQLSLRAAKQAGFTLIELIIVIVIIGILAAVAIPKLTGVSDQAQIAKNTAILGALKSAWGVAYATTKTTPTADALAAAMSDPTCTNNAGVLTCGATGVATTTFTYSPATTNPSPADITCTTADKCN